MKIILSSLVGYIKTGSGVDLIQEPGIPILGFPKEGLTQGLGVQVVYLGGGPRKQEQRNMKRGKEGGKERGGGEGKERHRERERPYKECVHATRDESQQLTLGRKAVR